MPGGLVDDVDTQKRLGVKAGAVGGVAVEVGAAPVPMRRGSINAVARGGVAGHAVARCGPVGATNDGDEASGVSGGDLHRLVSDVDDVARRVDRLVQNPHRCVRRRDCVRRRHPPDRPRPRREERAEQVVIGVEHFDPERAGRLAPFVEIKPRFALLHARHTWHLSACADGRR